MSLAAFMLNLDMVWTAIHLGVTMVICFGLCGFSVGIGARFPMFGQSNVARIANGLGGTVNLLASVALVAIVLTGVCMATWQSRYLEANTLPDVQSLVLCVLAAFLGIAAGCAALWVGARHFNRVEV
jgi:hypothetical protein